MRHIIFACVAWTICTAAAQGQTIVFSGAGANASQNFNTLSSVTGPTNAFANGTTLPGFYAFLGNGPVDATNYRVADGSEKIGSYYSFGLTSNANRAFGVVPASASGNTAMGFVLANTSATTNLSFSLGYIGEQWRDGGGNQNVPQLLNFSFRVFATLPTTTTDWVPGTQLPAGYTALSSLDFTSPISVNNGNGVALDGTLPANQTTFASTFIPATVAPGQYLVVRWYDENGSGNGHGLGIDNVSITSSVSPVPEPTSVLAVCGIAGFAGNVIRRRRIAAKLASVEA